MASIPAAAPQVGDEAKPSADEYPQSLGLIGWRPEDESSSFIRFLGTHGSHIAYTTKDSGNLPSCPISSRQSIKIGIKPTSRLSHVVSCLKGKFCDSRQQISDDAQLQFYWVDKRLNGNEIPMGLSTLQYRVLDPDDSGSIQVHCRTTALDFHMKLSEVQLEQLARDVESGAMVGSLRQTVAQLLHASNPSSAARAVNPNQVVIEAAGGQRPGPLQGSNWETRKVKSWLCRHIVIGLRHRGDVFVFKALNEEYIWHSPDVDRDGCVNARAMKHWLKRDLLTTIHQRVVHRRGIESDDIQLFHRDKVVKDRTRFRPGTSLEFRLSHAVEDAYVEAEAWLVPETETCAVCSEDKRVSEMPNQMRITTACEHESATCKECVDQWIASSLDTMTWDRLKCPECPQLLAFDDVRGSATRETFDRYDKLATKAAVGKLPEFQWCLNPRCEAGQIHPNGCTKAICHKCKHYSCVRHNVPWHKGETCAQFDRIRKHRKDDKLSEQHIKEITKPCPKCKRKVHKFSGCDHITCICGHEWCWLCLAVYYRGENGFLECKHTQQCRYHRNPPDYEGGRAFLPFTDFGGLPPLRPRPGGFGPPPGVNLPPFRRAGQPVPPPPPAPAPAPARPHNRPPPAPRLLNADPFEFFLGAGGNRHPFYFDTNIPRMGQLQREQVTGFIEQALLFDFGQMLQRAR
ncbi:Uu.00g008630.m01.CDS01 [Anthostomella pinea]|uniref:RBR-type E3 ubiquitin transferase n=1 Tax=Anthostomella pinea TaxID=933095 RepID=A0AAI8VX76_9PEZI|nr:Uu.00g008630.m01.CDS01 [Anthostomella pinea]